jgi:CubicO group peptidase (beta-lactamase class C family)
MPRLDRRHLLMGLGAALTAVPSLTVPAQQAVDAPSSDKFLRRLAEAEQSGKVHDLHALLVSRHGKLLFEHYGKGEDEGGGSRPGVVVTFGPEVLHDLRSVSKSVVGLVYGIALADGKVPPPEAKLYEQFPEYTDLAKQPGRDRLTIGHVLSMTLGIEWDELTIPYGTAGNSENAMEAAPDRFRFILERPIVGEPGVKWIYCGGATAILGRLIGKGTGERLPAYARRVLFDPMDFGPSDWRVGADGEPRAASGCRLLPRDMLKVGQLALAGGAWQGKQIVPADWVRRIITPAVKIEGARSYGYHWYIYDNMVDGQRQYWVGAIGWGGQRLYAFPGLDLVVAMNCGNYRQTGMEQSRVNLAVLTDVVFPSLA